jgi:hypothetical protein
MLRINLEFVRSSLCLVCFSFDDRDGTIRAVDREVSIPLMDDACTPVDNPLSDMTLSIIKSVKTYSTSFSMALN